VKNLAP